MISAARHVQDYVGDSQVPEVNISYITDEKLFFGSKMEQKLFIAVILCHVKLKSLGWQFHIIIPLKNLLFCN